MTANGVNGDAAVHVNAGGSDDHDVEDDAAQPIVRRPSQRQQPKPRQKSVQLSLSGISSADSQSPSKAEGDEDDEEKVKGKSNLENFKYYTSLFLGTLCLVCNFVFLFLVPFVLDPAISTLTHHFVDVPVACRVTSQTVKHGKSNCLWSSCREGCTADVFSCYQVRVVYTQKPWINGTRVEDVPPEDWVDLSRHDTLENKTMTDTPLLVNIKGCGYPPEITCPLFADKYENITDRGDTFPCYYSQVNPWIVIETYDYSENLAAVISSIVIPNVIFVVGLVILLFWYCPYCQERFGKYEMQNDDEEQDANLGLTSPIGSRAQSPYLTR